MAAAHDELPIGVAVVRRDRVIVSVNRRLAVMMGLASRDDAVGRDWSSFAHPRDRDRAIGEWDRAIAATKEAVIDLRIVRPDGGIVFFRVDVAPRDAQGSEWIATLADITLQREALMRLFMQAPAAIAITRGPDHVYELSNDMNQRLLGGRAVIGKSVREAFPEIEGQQIYELLQHVYRSGEAYVTNEIAAKALADDGTPRDVFLAGTYTPLFDSAGNVDGVMAFAYEVTEQVEARERQKFIAEAGRALASSLDFRATVDRAVQLAVPRLAETCFVDAKREDGTMERLATVGAETPDLLSTMRVPLVAAAESFGVMTFARKSPYDDDDRALAESFAARVAVHLENARLYAAATAASRAKDEFLATVSHELRTPLSSILGWASLVRAAPGDAAAVAKGLDVIERNARSQLRLVEDLLDLSRVVRGEMRLSLQTFSLATLAREVLETVSPSARAKDITLTLGGEADPFRLVADPDRLRQVMWNLLANAVKFTPGGGKVELALERGAGVVDIVVRDTGRGMDPSFVPQAFMPFRQADGKASGVAGGVGLGLAIVRHIVEAHGGHVGASSEGAGKGATFRATIPVASIARRVDETARNARFADRARRLEGRRILVVEDDPDGRELVELTLEREGASVCSAADATAALAEIEAGGPDAFDVVLSDIGLPERDGYWLAREIKKRLPEQRLVALTAFGRPEDVAKALDAGFAAHLTKPVDPNELVVALTPSSARAE